MGVNFWPKTFGWVIILIGSLTFQVIELLFLCSVNVKTAKISLLKQSKHASQCITMEHGLLNQFKSLCLPKSHIKGFSANFENEKWLFP